MNHTDHVYLLEGDPGVRARLGKPIRGAGGTWADLGLGGGAFTLALADLLQRTPAADLDPLPAEVISVDKDPAVLSRQETALRAQFPHLRASFIAADFTRPLDLPPLDGLVMANSLHFIPDAAKPALLARLKDCLKPGGQFILIEYNVDHGNIWVPHPLSLGTWQALALKVGFKNTRRLGARPSRFLGEIYSSIAIV